MSEEAYREGYNKLVESLKAEVDIIDFYTKITGNIFTKVDGRERTKIAWREDKNPSLSKVPNKNLLTDFTDTNSNTGKSMQYDILDILLKCGKAANRWQAIQIACDFANKKEAFEALVESSPIFKKQKISAKEEYAGNPKLGEAINVYWEKCKALAIKYSESIAEAPGCFNLFCKDRNIPRESIFIDQMNLGYALSYNETNELLGSYGLLNKGKDGKSDLGIFSKEFNNVALVFPLYNTYGALCGFRFRRLDQKQFSEWVPINRNCFFNAQRFKACDTNGNRIYLVEGEMNLVAFGIATFNQLKASMPEGDKDLQEHYIRENLDLALRNIYATGPKSTSVAPFNKLIRRLLYIQDHDVQGVSEKTPILEHPVIKTCLKVANEVGADETRIINWYAHSAKEKDDLESYLSNNNYDFKSIGKLQDSSIQAYLTDRIECYASSFHDPNDANIVRVKYINQIGQMLKLDEHRIAFFNRVQKIYGEILPKIDETSNITDIGLVINVAAGNKTIDYEINSSGNIVRLNRNEEGDLLAPTPMTGFYLRVGKEISVYDDTGLVNKLCTVEVVQENKVIKSFDVEAKHLVDSKKIIEALSMQCTFQSLKIYDDNIRLNEKKFTEIICGPLRKIAPRASAHAFLSVGYTGQGSENNECAKILNADHYCIMPKYSVIDGNIVANSSVIIHPKIEKTMPFCFEKIDDDEFLEIANLFWNNLRKIHVTEILDSIYGMVMDAGCRSLLRNSLLQNATHGFPLYLAGKSGSYKTTAALAGMWMVGSFNKQADIMDWHGTALSIEHQLKSAGTMIQCLDDLKIEDMKAKEFTSFFHNIYGGSTRTAMMDYGNKMKEKVKYKNSVIITAETENVAIPESIASRMLVLRLSRCSEEESRERLKNLIALSGEPPKDETDEDGDVWLCRPKIDEELRASLKMPIAKPKRHLLPGLMARMIAWAQKRGEREYLRTLNKWHAFFKKVAAAAKATNTERPVEMITRILTGYETLVQFYIDNKLISVEEGTDALKALTKFWESEALLQFQRIGSQSTSLKFVKYLRQMIASDSIPYRSFKGGKPTSDATYVRGGYPIVDITYDNGKRYILIVFPKSVIKEMNKLLDGQETVFIEDKVISELKEDGYFCKEMMPKPNRSGYVKKRPNKEELCYAIPYEKLFGNDDLEEDGSLF